MALVLYPRFFIWSTGSTSGCNPTYLCGMKLRILELLDQFCECVVTAASRLEMGRQGRWGLTLYSALHEGYHSRSLWQCPAQDFNQKWFPSEEVCVRSITKVALKDVRRWTRGFYLPVDLFDVIFQVYCVWEKTCLIPWKYHSFQHNVLGR